MAEAEAAAAPASEAPAALGGKAGEKAFDPFARAKNVLKQFDTSEKGAEKMERKVASARERRSSALKPKAEHSLTPPSLVMDSTWKSDKWTTQWSASKPEEVFGSFKQVKDANRDKLRANTQKFFSDLRSAEEKLAAAKKKQQEDDANRLKSAAKQSAAEDARLAKVAQSNHQQVMKFETAQAAQFEKSRKVLSTVEERRLKKIEELHKKEETRKAAAVQKMQLHDDEIARKKLEKLEKNEQKRSASGAIGQMEIARDAWMKQRAQKEAQKHQHIESMHANYKEAMTEFGKKKMATVEQKAEKAHFGVEQYAKKAHDKLESRMTAHEKRYAEIKLKHDQKAEEKLKKLQQKAQRLELRKKQEEEHRIEMLKKSRELIHNRDVSDEIALRASITKKLDADLGKTL